MRPPWEPIGPLVWRVASDERRGSAGIVRRSARRMLGETVIRPDVRDSELTGRLCHEGAPSIVVMTSGGPLVEGVGTENADGADRFGK